MLSSEADNWGGSLDCLMSDTLSIWSPPSDWGIFHVSIECPEAPENYSAVPPLTFMDRRKVLYEFLLKRINKYSQVFTDCAAVFLKIPFMSRLAARAQDEKYSLWHNTGIIKRYTFFWKNISKETIRRWGWHGIGLGQYLINIRKILKHLWIFMK